MKTADLAYTDVNLITLTSNRGWGVIRDGAMTVSGDRIQWVGRKSDLQHTRGQEPISCNGLWMTPGLVDCHTHLVYGGNRVEEFERRLTGESYADIAAAGGGIRATVEATRKADEETLYASARARLEHFLEDGITTMEVKSGYGLDTGTELKMLRVARRLNETLPIDIRGTFLGAHSIPPEYAEDRAGYIELVCNEMIPLVAAEGLADAVDCFCEHMAFTVDETRRVLQSAQAAGLAIKVHAEQLSRTGGASLAAEMGASSADHLEYVNEEDIAAMASAGTVAVLLPGAFYTLRETTTPPIEKFRSLGVPMAIASDSNPGSSPVLSLRQMMNMACTFFAMTPLEALQGVTVHAAEALNLNDRGILAPGMRADFALWDITAPADLAYFVGGQLCKGRGLKGRLVDTPQKFNAMRP